MDSQKFWEKWLRADELEKVELIKTLTLPSPKVTPEKLYEYQCAVLLNSYLVDAVDTVRRRIAKLLYEKGQPWIDQNISYNPIDDILEVLSD